MVSARQLNTLYILQLDDHDRFYPSSSQSGLNKKKSTQYSLQSKRKKSVQKDHPSFQPIENETKKEEGGAIYWWRSPWTLLQLLQASRGWSRAQYICISQYNTSRSIHTYFLRGRSVQPTAAAEYKSCELECQFCPSRRTRVRKIINHCRRRSTSRSSPTWVSSSIIVCTCKGKKRSERNMYLWASSSILLLRPYSTPQLSNSTWINHQPKENIDSIPIDKLSFLL